MELARIVNDTARRTGQDPQAVRDQAGAFIGRPEQVAAAIQAVVDVGFEYVIVYQPNMAEGGVIQRFAEEVIPLLRRSTGVAG
jgi:alkanesulfonate monooxygenase SsuD/methylene tetrahydromethanopterin reductase-like flavin-dependent oxidoreductase (luciferase family)